MNCEKCGKLKEGTGDKIAFCQCGIVRESIEVPAVTQQSPYIIDNPVEVKGIYYSPATGKFFAYVGGTIVWIK